MPWAIGTTAPTGTLTRTTSIDVRLGVGGWSALTFPVGPASRRSALLIPVRPARRQSYESGENAMEMSKVSLIP